MCVCLCFVFFILLHVSLKNSFPVESAVLFRIVAIKYKWYWCSLVRAILCVFNYLIKRCDRVRVFVSVCLCVCVVFVFAISHHHHHPKHYSTVPLNEVNRFFLCVHVCHIFAS